MSTISLSPYTPQVLESDSGTKSIIFKATLSTPASKTISIDYSTMDIGASAKAGVDYIPTYGVLNFTAGETIKTFSVSIIGDDIPEGNEMFRILLSNRTDILLNSFAEITIVNDDTEGAKSIFGTSNSDNLKGTINNDEIFGLAGNDIISGGKGADKLIGGLDDDIYIVNDEGDSVIEKPGEGNDTIKSSVDYKIPINTENIVLTGTKSIDGIGNSRNNFITGNESANTLLGGSGNDVLNGNLGDDILIGGNGKDIFQITNYSKDTIVDFSVLDDLIQLENSVFIKLSKTGILSADNFKIGKVATDTNDYVVYNNETGYLFYDANGNIPGGVKQIAILGAGLMLTNSDISVI